LGCDCDAAVSHGGKGDKKTHKNAEGLISKKLKSATPAQLNKYKMIAAKRMVFDVSKVDNVLIKIQLIYDIEICTHFTGYASCER
jgi:hypothetical protein